MTDRHHPAGRARALTGGLSVTATAAMVAAMGLPAAADPGASEAVLGTAVPATADQHGVGVPTAPTAPSADPVSGTAGTRLRIVVRRHHTTDGRVLETATLEPVGVAPAVAAPARAPAPAPAPRRSTRSGGS